MAQASYAMQGSRERPSPDYDLAIFRGVEPPKYCSDDVRITPGRRRGTLSPRVGEWM